MTTYLVRITSLVMCSLLVVGCHNRNKILNFEAYAVWINNPDNDLRKVKSLHGIDLTVKYLPPEYLAYQELKDMTTITNEKKDSVLANFHNKYTFLLSIETGTGNENVNIMYVGLKSQDDYEQ